MSQPYPVVGIEGTGTQLRLELRDLQKNPIQFSLFIQAMNKILGMTNTQDDQSPDSINNPNSWWQMGSIHGLPYNPWSGDPNGPQQPDPNAQWGGYCYHASALFPTWHRVLVLLIEQAVVMEAIAIATGLSNDEWLQAAKQLRFPYWDWTKLETAAEGIPQLLQQPKVNITNPDGSTVEVDNPLNHYNFTLKPGVVSGIEYMGDWNRTYRWANQDVNPTQEMYDQALQAFSVGTTLDLAGSTIQLQPVSWLREKVAGLFTYDLTPSNPSYGPNMWGYFSNTGAQSDGVEPPMAVMPPSIEESHNMVHLDTGGNGSMSINEYAGFDPIFFLHHCNVDRLYAFWEYVYPNYWIENGWMSSASGQTVPFVTDSGSFYQDAGATVDHSTGLTPFRNQALVYWTSDDTRGLLTTSPTNKYYTYPAIKDPSTGVEVKVDVPYDVNDLALRQQYQQILYNEWSPEIPAIIQAHRNLSTVLPQSKLLLKEENGVAHLRQFSVVGHLPEFAYPGSYRLELYLHTKDQHQTPAKVVNSISVLGRADPERCAACKHRRAGGSQVRGHMQLDPRVVLHLLGQLTPDQRAAITDVEHLAALVHGSLAVRLVRPDGKRLAVADPHVPAHHPPLEEAKTPKLTLHSHIIQVKPADATVPIKLGQHAAHGTLGKGLGWKAV